MKLVLANVAYLLSRAICEATQLGKFEETALSGWFSSSFVNK